MGVDTAVGFGCPMGGHAPGFLVGLEVSFPSDIMQSTFRQLTVITDTL